MDNFEEIVVDFEPMIYHLMHKYQIRDPEGEFYQEGTIALWRAYKKHDPAKSKFSTYAYYCIARCFLNKIEKENRERKNLQGLLDQVRLEDIVKEEGPVMDYGLLQEIQNVLTSNQWKWFVLFVLQDQSVRSIADRYGVTENAVKNWGKLARKKLRVVLGERGYAKDRYKSRQIQ